ncbi:hypothetical protein BDW75DRAFT_203489 [Aspergillus navahoensis]
MTTHSFDKAMSRKYLKRSSHVVQHVLSPQLDIGEHGYSREGSALRKLLQGCLFLIMRDILCEDLVIDEGAIMRRKTSGWCTDVRISFFYGHERFSRGIIVRQPKEAGFGRSSIPRCCLLDVRQERGSRIGGSRHLSLVRRPDSPHEGNPSSGR